MNGTQPFSHTDVQNQIPVGIEFKKGKCNENWL